jgi:hypothetical protein
VDASDHIVMGEHCASPLERVRLGASLRGGEREARCSETLGSLQVSQVLRLSLDTIARVHATVSYCYVEH